MLLYITFKIIIIVKIANRKEEKMILGIETKKDLRNQLEEAELRAVTHFNKHIKI